MRANLQFFLLLRMIKFDYFSVKILTDSNMRVISQLRVSCLDERIICLSLG